MKENTNTITVILILISIVGLTYFNLTRERIEKTPEVNMKEIKKKIIDSNQVIISGKIRSPKSREARFFNKDTSISTYVNFLGGFNTSFPLDSFGYITFHHGDEVSQMWCATRDTIYLEINTKEFDESIRYEGNPLGSSGASNYLAWKYLYQEENPINFDLSENEFQDNLLQIEKDLFGSVMDSLFQSVPYNNGLELFAAMFSPITTFIIEEQKQWKKEKEYIINRFETLKFMPKPGDPAKDFTYPDIDGNIVSLSDFKGNYVYVDVWATWCGPCRYEIPFLAELEKDYHDANIIFLSVSVDFEAAKQSWMNMVKEKNMEGVQLFASGWSQICQDYGINSIPRFMLFDPKGNVISTNAPRPSSEKIREIFDGFIGSEIASALISEGHVVVDTIENGTLLKFDNPETE